MLINIGIKSKVFSFGIDGKIKTINNGPVVSLPVTIDNQCGGINNYEIIADGNSCGLESTFISQYPQMIGMINGNNGTGRPGYFGPRPPANGQLHQYDFRIYALDADLDLDAGLNKEQLLEAMDGHILGTGLLMGHYERKE